MRQNWIEFKIRDEKKVSLRLEYITSIIEKEGYVWLCYDEKPFLDDDQKLASFHQVTEPYEQVKQKIMDAEKASLNDVVVEHFTREEYEYLRIKLEDEIPNSSIKHQILVKLYEILKEQ